MRKTAEKPLPTAARVVLCLSLMGALCSSQERTRAFDLAREFERIAAQGPLWPGFEPLEIPLAVFDGEHTLLFRHPAPPEGFAAVEASSPRAHAFPGRHPAVSANTSTEIGGILTATMMYASSAPSRSINDLAAVAVHEAFHVYQHGWDANRRGNEAALFLYPFADAQQLTLRRLETEALRRATSATDSAQSTCWAAEALLYREERFLLLDDAFTSYERGTELNEGLAAYVELKAAGRQGAELPAAGFGASKVRRRAYETGSALALLLDDARPGWHDFIESGEIRSLDEALAEALGAEHGERGGTCGFTDAELTRIERNAVGDVEQLVTDRANRKSAFLSRPGWRVTIRTAPDMPLWPKEFDPLNVERVEGGILHLRFLRLGNASGELELLENEQADLEALTEGLGAHPLFDGIRQFTITGLSEPEWKAEGQSVTVRGVGFKADFERAEVLREPEHLTVQLVAPQ